MTLRDVKAVRMSEKSVEFDYGGSERWVIVVGIGVWTSFFLFGLLRSVRSSLLS